MLIAIPSATGQQMREIVEHCKDSGIPFKTVPGYGELIDGRVSVKAIRDVAYQDLLGRDAVKLDEKGIGAYIEGNCVMITGAGGSIGSELCRQVCRFNPKEGSCCMKEPKARYTRSNSSSNGISTMFASSQFLAMSKAQTTCIKHLMLMLPARSFMRPLTSTFP